MPDAVLARAKQPYRASDVPSFFDAEGRARFAWVDELLSPSSIRAGGVFDPAAVELLVKKVRRGPAGAADGMALVGVLSTELLIEELVKGVGFDDQRAA